MRAQPFGRARFYPYYNATSAVSCSRHPMRRVRADGAPVCIASPRCGRSPCLPCPCQCPFLDGGPVHSGHSQDIGVDFALAARFTQNSQKKHRRVRHLDIAPCNCRTSQGATRQLRTLRLTHVAPCDIATSHLATSRYRTLRLSPVAPCDSKTPFSTPKSRPTTAVPCPLHKVYAREGSRVLIPRHVRHPRHTGENLIRDHRSFAATMPFRSLMLKVPFCKAFAGCRVERSAPCCRVRPPPHRTVRAVFPHTAHRVRPVTCHFRLH